MFEIKNTIEAIHALMVADNDVLTAFGAGNIHKWYPPTPEYMKIIPKPFLNIMPAGADCLVINGVNPRGSASAQIPETDKIQIEMGYSFELNPTATLDIVDIAKKVVSVIVKNTNKIGSGNAILKLPITGDITVDPANNTRNIMLNLEYTLTTNITS